MARRQKKPGEKVRVGMVGAGKLSTAVHYPSLASFDDVQMAGICDIDPTKLKTLADQYEIEKRYTDYRKMVDELDLDAVYVIGQPHQMYDIWMWCLERGQNLFVEKPLALTLHQTRNLADAAAANACITQTGFHRRSSPIANLLRDLCLARGPITHGVCRFYKCNFFRRTGALDNLMEDGVHAVDMLRWTCGGEVVHIDSVSRRVMMPDHNLHMAILQFDSGSTGVLLTNWVSGRRIFAVEMHAPGICAEVEPEGKGWVYADGDTKGVEYDAKEVAGSDEMWAYGGYRVKDREFVDCVKSGEQPGSHFGDAYKTMEVAHKVLAQALLAS